MLFNNLLDFLLKYINLLRLSIICTYYYYVWALFGLNSLTCRGLAIFTYSLISSKLYSLTIQRLWCICNKSFYKRGQLTTRLSSHTPKINKPRETFQCEICNRAFYKRCFTTHMKKHKRIKQTFACDVCDYIAKKPSHLLKHNDIHQGVRYSCDECDHRATSPSNLNTHKRRKHEGVK